MLKKNIEKPFPIACVGASAGGLEALTLLFKSIPMDINMAFVLVQHLEPHHQSMLAEILSKATSLRIQYAKNNVKVKPGMVYVITPNSFLTISHGILKTAPRVRNTKGTFLPVDSFMVSLASDQGKNAVGIVLSGTGSDGTIGVKEIKAKRGITFAQDNKSSKYYSMPAAAITSGKIDFILDPAGIAEKLAGIAARRRLKPQPKKEVLIDKTETMDAILRYLSSLSNVDFIHYKRNTLERRINRRMGFRKIRSLNEYYDYLKREPAETQALYKDILIPLTKFFRDPGVFAFLRHKLLPRLIKNRRPGDPIRVWVPACSTGEEVYSIAITMYEFLEEKNMKPNFQIFATDLSEANIEKSRIGCYSVNIAANVSTVRLRRFFTETDVGYKIDKNIREKCIFAKQDVTNDPPLSNMDIISCRNLLIYLDRVLQNKVLRVLHYALKPEGYLILGTAESIAFESGFFTVLDRRNKVYLKNAGMTGKAKARDRLSLEAKPLSGKAVPGVKKEPVKTPGARVAARQKSTASAAVDKKDYDKMGLTELKKELRQTKKRLEKIIEDKDIFNEKLTAANEEIQSANEELQSTNEELETSKEELESTNEELLTVNEEMQNKNAELNHLNNDLSNVLTSVNIPLIIVNAALCIIRFTPMAKKFINLIPSDVGRPISDFKLSFDISNLEQIILDVIENIGTVEMEVKDQEGKWHSLRIRPYKTLENKIEGAVISLIDIDTVKRIQNDLQDALDYSDSIIETVREALLVLDNQLNILSANKSFERLFRVSSGDIKNKPLYHICGKAFEIPELKRMFDKLLSKNAGFGSLELTFDCPQGEKKIISLIASLLYLRGKNRQMILVAIADITARKKYEDIMARDAETMKKLVSDQSDSLIKAQLEIEAGKRLSDIGILAATVAHELRNPLAAIQISVHNIRRKTKDPDLDKNLSSIEKKIGESDQIINNLLFYSRLKPLHPEAMNIADAIEESLSALDAIFKKDISVIKNFDPLRNILIDADPIQIKEVINNLLINAYDAVSSGEAKIEIIGVLEKKFARVTIKDNGRGIDKDTLGKIFGPFFTTKAKGTGLGLTVSKRIAEVHGGTIGVESELGKGTSVTVRLPRKQPEKEK